MNNLNEKTLKQNLLYEGKVISLYVDDVSLPNKKTAKREYVKHPGGVGILAIKDRFVYLVKQFRYPFKDIILEIPAGKLDKNEDPTHAAIREFSEEMGLEIKSLHHLGNIYPSVGYTNEIIHLYFTDDFISSKQHTDPDEFLNVVKMPINEFDKKILNNEIKDAKTIASYLFYKQKTN